MNLLDDAFPMSYHKPKMEIVLTYPNGAHMTFGASSTRGRFFDVQDF